MPAITVRNYFNSDRLTVKFIIIIILLDETESEETEPENACSIPTIANGTAHIVNCNEIQCTVYYSCDHDNHFELYPEEKRGQRFQCNHGVWEDHTVTCASKFNKLMNMLLLLLLLYLTLSK